MSQQSETQRVLRHMAWERTKGELNAIQANLLLGHFKSPEKCEEAQAVIREFVHQIEFNGLFE